LTNNPSGNPVVEWLGYVLYGIYVFAALIVLMNLLIAVMSNTFQEVQASTSSYFNVVFAKSYELRVFLRVNKYFY